MRTDTDGRHRGRLGIAPGTFWRLHRPVSLVPFAVVYQTRARTVTLLEGDSAEVYALLARHLGSPEPALRYIIEHGPSSPEAARDTLDEFAKELVAVGILGSADASDSAASRGSSAEGRAAEPPNSRDITDLARSIEQQVSQRMADARICHSLVLELTYRCNLRCVHCYCPVERRTEELDVPAVDQLLADFAHLGGLRLLLTGGEVLLRVDFEEILGVASAHGLVIDVNSSLTLLDERTVRALEAVNPRCVATSLYSADPRVHDRVTGVKGSFDRTVAGVRRLKEEGLPVAIKSPILGETLTGWPALVALAEELGCEQQLDLGITARNDGDQATLARRADDAEGIRALYRSRFFQIYTRDELFSPAMPPDPEAALFGAGAAGLAVSPDGTIRPCIGLLEPLGRNPEASLSSVWNGSRWFETWQSRWLADIPACRSCDAIRFCSRCPGAWALETGAVDRPSPFTCQLARLWKEAHESPA